MTSNLAAYTQSAVPLSRLAAAENSLHVASLLAASGGYLDAFTYLGHGHVFANAMTGNIVLMAAAAGTGDWRQSLRHFPPLIAFLLGVAVAQIFQMPRVRPMLRNPAIASLTAEMLFLLAGGWFPESFPEVPLVLGISFLAALQSSAFRRVGDWTYNSTMTTGSLRIFGEAAFRWIFRHDDATARQRTTLFASVCLAFFGGALLGGLCTWQMKNRALWVVDLLLLGAWIPLVVAWRQSRTDSL
jgi:uncharacterized membrane protein YoaK (UPF0700 family)